MVRVCQPGFVGAPWQARAMDLTGFVPALRAAGEHLASAAERAGPGAAVPTCPGWTVRDLVLHTGGVHRWAATTVREARTKPLALAQPQDIEPDLPGDGDLVDWFSDGHRALVEAIEKAPEDLACWSFLPAPSPLLFWARRQTHETTIHRYDAESAAGAPTELDPEVASDGVDELLAGFVARPSGRLRSAEPVTVAFRATDTGRRWRLRIGEGPVQVTEDEERAATVVEAAAARLYLALWNRIPITGLPVTGAEEPLRHWPELVRVRWN
jgi:uncharacterized protein (TIGR03083 family)